MILDVYLKVKKWNLIEGTDILFENFIAPTKANKGLIKVVAVENSSKYKGEFTFMIYNDNIGKLILNDMKNIDLKPIRNDFESAKIAAYQQLLIYNNLELFESYQMNFDQSKFIAPTINSKGVLVASSNSYNCPFSGEVKFNLAYNDMSDKRTDIGTALEKNVLDESWPIQIKNVETNENDSLNKAIDAIKKFFKEVDNFKFEKDVDYTYEIKLPKLYENGYVEFSAVESSKFIKGKVLLMLEYNDKRTDLYKLRDILSNNNSQSESISPEDNTYEGAVAAANNIIKNKLEANAKEGVDYEFKKEYFQPGTSGNLTGRLTVIAIKESKYLKGSYTFLTNYKGDFASYPYKDGKDYLEGVDVGVGKTATFTFTMINGDNRSTLSASKSYQNDEGLILNDKIDIEQDKEIKSKFTLTYTGLKAGVVKFELLYGLIDGIIKFNVIE
ncbi:hypothetical protein SLITO_v1c06430 [Spiroplasma litorale]|uniref:Uncharacterized protein n=1 Tax=Spiroplasma litorale TaxID=216942 RepID=A0A0K1W2G8_9MOLU|nr:hypothetical protein [Spiroplasma litorale]AKX34272.1 hypothetical protein SLITO_v1c06430 [Spiroplasma litorale]